jgi:NTP pyrophosphatase (non-canonical NTP hydrolase)
MSAEPGSERDKLELSDALEGASNCADRLGDMAQYIHRLNRLFYLSTVTGEPLKFSKELAGTKICLMHSELSEALEGLRKGKQDDHLPHRKAEEVELADAIIRILDYCGWRGFDIAGALAEKLAYNATRQDHTHEARRAVGGKSF